MILSTTIDSCCFMHLYIELFVIFKFLQEICFAKKKKKKLLIAFDAFKTLHLCKCTEICLFSKNFSLWIDKSPLKSSFHSLWSTKFRVSINYSGWRVYTIDCPIHLVHWSLPTLTFQSNAALKRTTQVDREVVHWLIYMYNCTWLNL